MLGLCLLWLHCDVEIEPGLHGAGKSTVFECLALAESWVLRRDCRITMDCRTFAILFLVLLSFRFFFRLNCGGIAWRFGDWTRMLRIAQRRRLDCRLYSYCRLHSYLVMAAPVYNMLHILLRGPGTCVVQSCNRIAMDGRTCRVAHLVLYTPARWSSNCTGIATGLRIAFGLLGLWECNSC